MVFTVELPDELETLLRLDSEAQGTSPADSLAHYVADIYANTVPDEDPAAVREISEAIKEYGKMRGSGEVGIPASEVYADLCAVLIKQQRKAA